MSRLSVMKSLGVVAGMAALISIMIWLVRAEGERTREAIRHAARDASEEMSDGLSEAAEVLVEKAAELPRKVLEDVKETVIGESKTSEPTREDRQPEEPHPDKTVEKEGSGTVVSNKNGEQAEAELDLSTTASRQQGRNTNEKEKAVDSTSTTVGSEKATSTADESPSVELVTKVFDFGRDLAESVDEIGQEVFQLSVEEENQLGREVTRLVGMQQHLLRNRNIENRLRRLAQPFVAQRSRKKIEYTFRVIDDPELNAFAHLGGHVYVTKGMLDFVNNDTELQFVLAHEVAHVDLKHCVQQVTYAARAGQVTGELGGSLAQVAYTAISLGHSEEREFAADKWAYDSMQQLGHSQQETLVMLRRFAEYERSKNVGQPRREPENAVDKTVQEIQDHLRSHPPTDDRVNRLGYVAND